MYRKRYENLRHISFAFRGRIPNGHKVPHPCNPTSDKWVAVGHMLSGGRGPRNPFGDDFAANGNVSDLYIYIYFLPYPSKLILINDNVATKIVLFYFTKSHELSCYTKLENCHSLK